MTLDAVIKPVDLWIARYRKGIQGGLNLNVPVRLLWDRTQFQAVQVGLPSFAFRLSIPARWDKAVAQIPTVDVARILGPSTVYIVKIGQHGGPLRVCTDLTSLPLVSFMDRFPPL